ncbi:hypothetical protein NM688_g327 [Phlebia brevispora]|uniref:Uncharacterized protein n=1 Tax=Phlebia brevispora TaxID=194682 RepID=A0ACC1TEZ9_9APHY|nr:hypothetical protein NM688_g327 [Phlebia brevispora]
MDSNPNNHQNRFQDARAGLHHERTVITPQNAASAHATYVAAPAYMPMAPPPAPAPYAPALHNRRSISSIREPYTRALEESDSELHDGPSEPCSAMSSGSESQATSAKPAFGSKRNSSKPPSARGLRQTDLEKLYQVFDAIKKCGWSLLGFLDMLFRVKDSEGKIIRRDRRHATTVSRFLQESGVGKILKCWFEDPSGRPDSDSEEAQLMYTTDVPYLELTHARTIITSFAAQLVRDEMLREVRKVVKRESGLQGTGTSERGRKEMSWADIGPNTLRDVMRIIQECQPLTWQLVKELITPPVRKKNGVLVVRKSRPPELTSTEIISTINFARVNTARRLPAARAVLYFACGAQQTLFTYGCRVGHLLSWKATCRLLRRLGAQTSAEIRELGCSEAKAGIVRFDNVQRWFKQRELRMGREDRMNIGVAATVAEVIDFDPEAFDLDEHLAEIRRNKRDHLRVDDFLALIDLDHMYLMGELQWLETVVNIVPQLRRYKPRLAEIRRTEGAKLRVPVHRTVVHPLGTVAKNEAVTVELRDALLDFLAQMGIKEGGGHKRQVVYVGGDGMSFEKTIVCQYYSQFEEDDVRSLVVIEPFLEIWHTAWTNLSSIFEAHWGDPLTKDPSRLAHNAAKIGQKAPANLKKVDFYPASFFAYLILDARMLDCWRLHFETIDLFEHFKQLEAEEKLPTLEELRVAARILYRRYSSRHAYYCAMHGENIPGTAEYIPAGTPWTAPIQDETSRLAPPKGNAKKKKASELQESVNEAFVGDQCLAQSIMFMNVTLISREIASAIADGDIGRVYEGIKYLLFTFAGSKHHPRYATLLLEQVTRLEWETNPKRKAIFFKNWLVNTAGEAGRFKPGDIMQEALNLVLEEMIRRNDTDWDTPRVREVIAPNVAFMNDLKNHWGDGLGLAPRRSRHPEPHSRPEMRTLLQVYNQEELHMFRAGRSYDRNAEDVDTFAKGIAALEKGKLKRWIDTTIRARNLAHQHATQDTVQMDTIFNFDDDGDDNNDGEAEHLTAGGFTWRDGELIVETEVRDDENEQGYDESDDSDDTDNDSSRYVHLAFSSLTCH